MGESEEVCVGGVVALCCRLSSSFVLASLYLNEESQAILERVSGVKYTSPVLDCVVRSADGQSRSAVAAIEKTLRIGASVLVKGHRILEKCNCSVGCNHVVLHLFDAADQQPGDSGAPAWVTEASASEGRTSIRRALSLVKAVHEDNGSSFPGGGGGDGRGLGAIYPSNRTLNAVGKAEARKRAIIRRREAGRVVEASDGGQGKQRQRRNVKKRDRSARFVEWCMRQFGGRAVLREAGQDAILDVAGGGQGGVSYEFQVRFGVSSLIVDPREEILSATQRRTLKFRRQSRAQLAAAMGFSVEGAKEGIEGETEIGGGGAAAAAAAAAASATSTPTHHSHLALKIFNSYKDYEKRQIKMLVDDDFETSREGSAALMRARVLVGMHPDSATDYIVKLGQKHKKCGAVVPCCVFPKHFGYRKLPPRTGDEGESGGERPVRTYDELCEWLISRFKLREERLQFEGRNRVLFW